MLDCGMHMGYNDDVTASYLHIFFKINNKYNFAIYQRRFPDFSYIAKEGPVTSYLDCVIIRLLKSSVYLFFK